MASLSLSVLSTTSMMNYQEKIHTQLYYQMSGSILLHLHSGVISKFSKVTELFVAQCACPWHIMYQWPQEQELLNRAWQQGHSTILIRTLSEWKAGVSPFKPLSITLNFELGIRHQLLRSGGITAVHNCCSNYCLQQTEHTAVTQKPSQLPLRCYYYSMWCLLLVLKISI